MNAVRWFARASAAVGFVALIGVGFATYFVTSFDPATHQWHDIFGRRLEQSPGWAVLIGEDGLWAGLGWRVIDTVVFFGSIWVLFAVYTFGSRERAEGAS